MAPHAVLTGYILIRQFGLCELSFELKLKLLGGYKDEHRRGEDFCFQS